MKIKRIIIAALCMFGLFFGLCLGIGFTAVYSACARTEDEELVDFIVEVETGRDIRVLQLTDPQVIDESQERYQARVGSNWAYGREYIHYERYIKQVINNYKPDFIIVTGDVVYGEFDDSGRALVEYIEFMESFKIPWAPIFGNHDQESNMGADWQCEQFENAEYCLFKQRTLTGNGNYTVGLKQGGELKRVFFMLDSNGCGGASAISMANGHTKTGVGFGNDQIEWYTAAANAIKTKSPSTKLSFAFHIQLQAFADAYEKYGFDNSTTQSNPINIDTHSEKADGDFGYLGRNLKSAWDSDYTVYNGLKALGVDSFFVGHEHCNSASVVYDGIRFQFVQLSS